MVSRDIGCSDPPDTDDDPGGISDFRATGAVADNANISSSGGFVTQVP